MQRRDSGYIGLSMNLLIYDLSKNVSSEFMVSVACVIFN